jgi:hypothetical protein
MTLEISLWLTRLTDQCRIKTDDSASQGTVVKTSGPRLSVVFLLQTRLIIKHIIIYFMAKYSDDPSDRAV